MPRNDSDASFIDQTRRRTAGLVPAFLIGSALPSAASGQVNPDPAWTRRAQQLPAAMARALQADAARLKDYEEMFSDAFRAKVPERTFRTTAALLFATWGSPVEIEDLVAEAPFSGIVELGYKRATVPAYLSVDPEPPHRVVGLKFGQASQRPAAR